MTDCPLRKLICENSQQNPPTYLNNNDIYNQILFETPVIDPHLSNFLSDAEIQKLIDELNNSSEIERMFIESNLKINNYLNILREGVDGAHQCSYLSNWMAKS